MASGGTALFLGPAAFRRPGAPDGSIDWLPLPVKGRCDPFANSIYHREDVSRRHPVFDGLPAGGIMDWSFYRDVIPHRIFTGQEAPPEVVVACFALGYTCPTGYTSGFVTGAYPFGAGRFMVNTLRLLEHLGTHPVADRIALNMVCHAARSVVICGIVTRVENPGLSPGTGHQAIGVRTVYMPRSRARRRKAQGKKRSIVGLCRAPCTVNEKRFFMSRLFETTETKD